MNCNQWKYPRRSSVSGRVTRSRSRNASIDMPPPPPHAFHGYAGGYVPTGGTARSLSGHQPGWDQYIPQPETGTSSWQSVGSTDWEQAARTNWGYSGSSSSSGAPSLFAAWCSFSARSYHEISQGIQDLNVRCDDIDQTTQQI